MLSKQGVTKGIFTTISFLIGNQRKENLEKEECLNNQEEAKENREETKEEKKEKLKKAENRRNLDQNK